ncbi:D-amino-acid dehydrogenase [Melghirimyces thermohalophilus]|uniref:D-amino-acid dehydrogenase n=1 Tax=Melghirimyces thermohalophilus TaxID=1236220 RepID=A0A1G6RTX5_9BACL|nr:D-amino-acid dehydrogenase [Melghirimyces thermohalophilus]
MNIINEGVFQLSQSRWWVFGIIVLSISVLIGCGNEEASQRESSEPAKEEASDEELTFAKDAAGMLHEGPGKLAGDKYSEERLKEELEKFPDDLEAKEAYARLVKLLAEDYEPVLEKINAFDTNPFYVKQGPGDLEAPDAPQEKLRVVMLLDASGSMAGTVEDGRKMDVAKAAINRFAASLPPQAEVSLRVYGHEGSNQKKDKERSCRSTESVYPFSPYQEADFQKSLDQFQPTGWTPIARAMKAAQKDLEKGGKNTKNLIYVVSDGEETCGGDPVKVAKQMHESDVEAVVNIIGFDLQDQAQQELKKAAEAGGGEYHGADSEADLRQYLDEQNRKLRIAWMDWGIENREDIRHQYVNKHDELGKIAGTNGELYELINAEKKRMLKAHTLLAKMGKVTGDQRDELYSGIVDRGDELLEFQKDKFESLERLLKINRNAFINQIEDKVKQKGDEYQ